MADGSAAVGIMPHRSSPRERVSNFFFIIAESPPFLQLVYHNLLEEKRRHFQVTCLPALPLQSQQECIGYGFMI